MIVATAQRRHLHGDHHGVHGGYNEVRPIDSPTLSAITIALIVLGCTGIIFLTGALVQFFTHNSSADHGSKAHAPPIDQLEGHVVVCGFGRLGAVLARSLSASSAGLVILEDNEARAAEARERAICASKAMRPARQRCTPPA